MSDFITRLGERETWAWVVTVIIAFVLYRDKAITADQLMMYVAGSGVSMQLSRGLAKFGTSTKQDP